MSPGRWQLAQCVEDRGNILVNIGDAVVCAVAHRDEN